MVKERLHLVPERWYGWQMLPGYFGQRNVPYFSPIRVVSASPRNTGNGILGLTFWNQLYAQGVQEAHVEMRIIQHQADYLIADLLTEGSGSSGRSAVVSHIEFEWIRVCCPDLWRELPVHECSPAAQHSVSLYLDEVFPH